MLVLQNNWCLRLSELIYLLLEQAVIYFKWFGPRWHTINARLIFRLYKSFKFEAMVPPISFSIVLMSKKIN